MNTTLDHCRHINLLREEDSDKCIAALKEWQANLRDIGIDLYIDSDRESSRFGGCPAQDFLLLLFAQRRATLFVGFLPKGG
jgi:hypothetical protein